MRLILTGYRDRAIRIYKCKSIVGGYNEKLLLILLWF